MTSFLITKKDNKSYEEKLSSAPESTKRNKAYAVQVFEKFYNPYSMSQILTVFP